MHFLNFGTIPLGGLLGGALGQAYGIRPTMWLMTAAVAAAPLMLLIGPIRRNRDLPDGQAGALQGGETAG